MLDVNAGFAAERATQIGNVTAARADAAVRQADFDRRVAEGKLVPLGNGRFRVNEPGSFDNNETWYQRSPREIPMPESQLDLDEQGRARLYTRVPTWHALEQAVYVEGISDVATVLKISGGDYEVEKVPAQYAWEGKLLTDPRSFLSVRKDTGTSFGAVGTIYTHLQNHEGFEFLQNLVDDDGLVWETAAPLDGGRKFFITLKVPEGITIDAEGVNDHVELFIAAVNSHDGQTPFQVVVTPWRIICGNTNRFAVRDAITRWKIRHTKTAKDRFEEARRTLKLTLNYADSWVTEETQLLHTPATLGTVDDLIAEIWESKEEPTDLQKRREDERTGQLHHLFRVEKERVGANAYGVENAFTAWLDHAAPRRGAGDKMAAARATAALEGADDDKKAKVHRQLLTLTNR